MSYETSYDASSGSSPFKPNKNRGFWSNSSDFFYACMCNAFRMDIALGITAVHIAKGGGISMLISLLVNVVLFAYPFVFMQSFLGQFSSSGFISAFRIAPLFKGIGYIALASNLFSLTFYAIFAAIPLQFLINSLQPTLPWGCEAWLLRNQSHNATSHCSHNQTDDAYFFDKQEIPSMQYFWEQFQNIYSVSLYGCVIVVWLVVAYALCNTTEKIGQMLRYSSLTLITLLCIVFLRMMFLPGVLGYLAMESFRGFNFKSIILSIVVAPMFTISTFGPGWGSILTMASYNKFKTDINKFSWLICFSQFGMLLLTVLLSMLTEFHLKNGKFFLTEVSDHELWVSFLSIPSSLETMELPHLWTWIFLLALTIGNINLMITQMFSVLTALFDEYETLRAYKVEVTLGLSGILVLVSALYCTRIGMIFIESMAELSISTQAIINLLLLVIVVWVYGRERFQRDYEFMTSQVLQTWKIYIARFVTPLFLPITLICGFCLLIIKQLNYFNPPGGFSLGAYLTIFSWSALPVYCVLKLLQTNGSFAMRFKRCVKPTDWYPTDLEHRQRYEVTIDNPDIFQPLTTIDL